MSLEKFLPPQKKFFTHYSKVKFKNKIIAGGNIKNLRLFQNFD